MPALSLSLSLTLLFSRSRSRALSLMDRYMSKPINLQMMKILLGDLQDGRLQSKYGSEKNPL
jgi:hypothetical protein